MLIAVKTSIDAQKDFFLKNVPSNIELVFMQPSQSFETIEADAYFDFMFDDQNISSNYFINAKPVFVNAVCCTCHEINHKNYIRINGWPGFLERKLFEVCCQDDEYKLKATEIFNELMWKYIWVIDQPGFVSARIISMIINEAWFAFSEGVSSKEEIDIAMKLGTNYPFGPFEWGERIGLKNIYGLLKKMNTQNSKYEIANLLISNAS